MLNRMHCLVVEIVATIGLAGSKVKGGYIAINARDINSRLDFIVVNREACNFLISFSIFVTSNNIFIAVAGQNQIKGERFFCSQGIVFFGRHNMNNRRLLVSRIGYAFK